MMLSPSARESRQPGRPFNDDQLVYFRLKPEIQALLAMDELRRTHGLPRTFACERLHITLLPLGDIWTISPETLRRIRLAAASLQAEPFPLAFHRLDGNLLRGQNMHAAKDFQSALVRRLEAFGVIVPDYDFDPHVSLAYTEWRQRNIMLDPIRWTGKRVPVGQQHPRQGP